MKGVLEVSGKGGCAGSQSLEVNFLPEVDFTFHRLLSSERDVGVNGGDFMVTNAR